jgi:hypothetical protein
MTRLGFAKMSTSGIPKLTISHAENGQTIGQNELTDVIAPQYIVEYEMAVLFRPKFMRWEKACHT